VVRERLLSGVQPSGRATLGNFLGVFQQWRESQAEFDSIFLVVDQHAITVEHDPAELRERVREMTALLLAAGIDPDRATIVRQSQVAAHSQLAWVLECTVTYGELTRMTQFKDKSRRHQTISAGLFTYPALMAADILLYDAEVVPVGEDQVQHLELTRVIAQRFNHRYGETFRLPRAVVPKVAARVMDLAEPTAKMSKSSDSAGNVYLLDSDADIRRKVMRAKTDSFNEVVYRPDDPDRAGVTNLLEILAGLTGESPEALAMQFTGYGALKEAVADAVTGALAPVRERTQELLAHPTTLDEVLARGHERAETLASAKLEEVYARVGFA
jgi:tryptophanyl-tRNA synthetase